MYLNICEKSLTSVFIFGFKENWEKVPFLKILDKETPLIQFFNVLKAMNQLNHVTRFTTSQHYNFCNRISMENKIRNWKFIDLNKIPIKFMQTFYFLLFFCKKQWSNSFFLKNFRHFEFFAYILHIVMWFGWSKAFRPCNNQRFLPYRHFSSCNPIHMLYEIRSF